MSGPDLQDLHGIPLDTNGPVFRAPWQAQAFAVVVHLQDQGVFSWGEWAEQLARCIAAALARGDADLGDTYYDHWLGALEALLTSKGLVSQQSLDDHHIAIQHERSRLHEHH